MKTLFEQENGNTFVRTAAESDIWDGIRRLHSHVPVVLPPDDSAPIWLSDWRAYIAIGMGRHAVPRNNEHSMFQFHLPSDVPMVDAAEMQDWECVTAYCKRVMRYSYVVLPQSLEHQMNAERKWWEGFQDGSMPTIFGPDMPIPTPVPDWVR
jgi:hypothetical protein